MSSNRSAAMVGGAVSTAAPPTRSTASILVTARWTPDAACSRAEEALDQLAVTWYATGMECIRDVRQTLQPWVDHDCVRRIDDRLYGWQATVNALRR